MIRKVLLILILIAGVGAVGAEDASEYLCVWLLSPTTIDFGFWGVDETVVVPAHEVVFMLISSLHGEDPLMWDSSTYYFMRDFTEAVYECEELIGESGMSALQEALGGGATTAGLALPSVLD